MKLVPPDVVVGTDLTFIRNQGNIRVRKNGMSGGNVGHFKWYTFSDSISDIMGPNKADKIVIVISMKSRYQ